MGLEVWEDCCGIFGRVLGAETGRIGDSSADLGRKRWSSSHVHRGH